MRVRKAVIPAAGFGTRFLPATRSVSKVMLPVLDRPTIHYAVQEAVESGLEQVVIVVSPGQDAVGDYFGRIPALERALERIGDEATLGRMLEISEMADVTLVYQEQRLGLGHAVLTAKASVGDEPFAVILPDDLIWSDRPTIGSMIELFSSYQGSLVAVKEVPTQAIPNLGVVDPRPVDDTLSRVVAMVEKPRPEEAPSNLAIIGRYVLTPDVFEALERGRPGALGEIQLTDAIAALLSTQEVYAYRFPGFHVDAGTPLGLLKAAVYAALQREDLSPDLKGWLRSAL